MSPRLTLALIASLSILAACGEPPVAPMTSDVAASRDRDNRGYRQGEAQLSVEATRGSLAIYPAGVGQNLAQTFRVKSDQWLGYLQAARRLRRGCAAQREDPRRARRRHPV